MATNTWINVGGDWKETKSVWVNNDGVWKKDVVPKGNIEGVWKDFKNYGDNTSPGDTSLIVTDGLVGYWHYLQSVIGSTWSNIAPATEGQYVGTINGAVLQEEGMYFDGVDDSVIFPNLGIVNKSFTIEVRGFYSGNNGYLVINDFTHRIGFWAAGSFVQSIFNGGGFCNSPNNSVISGQWYTLTYRYDYTLKREELFINGSSVSSRTNATTTNLNTGFKMASDPFNAAKYQGHIPFLRIYDKALTNQQIIQNYEAGTAIGLNTF